MEVTAMGLTGMVFSLISIAAGAVMYWAVTSQGHGFRLSTVGVILMVVGVVGLVISTVVFAMARRPAGTKIAPSTAPSPTPRAAPRRCTKRSIPESAARRSPDDEEQPL